MVFSDEALVLLDHPWRHFRSDQASGLPTVSSSLQNDGRSPYDCRTFALEDNEIGIAAAAGRRQTGPSKLYIVRPDQRKRRLSL